MNVSSKTLKLILGLAVGLIILLLVFKLGLEIGYRKASFSFDMGEKYFRNLAGPRPGMMPMGSRFFRDDYLTSRGAFGEIISVDKQGLIMKDSSNIEKTVVFKASTTVSFFRETIKPEDLKSGYSIVVIGQPKENGEILADFIRVMPRSEFFSPELAP